MFHRVEPLTKAVWEKLLLGLSTRKYSRAVREFAEAYDLKKTAMSEHFIEASREKLKEMMERRLGTMRLCALFIEATPFSGQHMVVGAGHQPGRRKRSWAFGKELWKRHRAQGPHARGSRNKTRSRVASE